MNEYDSPDDFGITQMESLKGEPLPWYVLWERHGKTVSLHGAVVLDE